jgi:hypothetical protein
MELSNELIEEYLFDMVGDKYEYFDEGEYNGWVYFKSNDDMIGYKDGNWWGIRSKHRKDMKVWLRKYKLERIKI